MTKDEIHAILRVDGYMTNSQASELASVIATVLECEHNTADAMARLYVEQFKRDLYAVPTFGHRINKETRAALSTAHLNMMNLPAELDKLKGST